jgi:hypothetical protein
MLRRSIKIEFEPEDPGLVHYRLGPSKLYLDDVNLIYETLIAASKERAGDGNSPAPVVITAGEATADSPEDLRDATSKELKKVTVGLDDPLLFVELWATHAGVTAKAADREGKALATGIRDYIKSRRTLSAIRPSGGFWNLLIVAGCIIFNLFIGINIAHQVGIPLNQIALKITALGLIEGIAILLIRMAITYRVGAARIMPRLQNEVRGFTSERRTQLAVALASAVVSAVLLGLAGLWAGVFH